MSKGHCKLKNTSTDLPDCRISLWCCRKPIFRDRYLVYRTRTDQCKMPAAETSGELIHSFRQPPYWPWCHKYYLPRLYTASALCMKIRWEKKNCLTGSPLCNYCFTFTHLLSNPKPCKDFSGYGIFRLQLKEQRHGWRMRTAPLKIW